MTLQIYIWPSKYRALQTYGVKKNTEYKHRRHSHDAHRHCTLPIKRRCARISNMKITNMKGGRISKYKSTYSERNDPQETPCTLPQDKQEEHCVIANAHNECMRIQRILKSQRQRGIKYPEEKMFTRV